MHTHTKRSCIYAWIASTTISSYYIKEAKTKLMIMHLPPKMQKTTGLKVQSWSPAMAFLCGVCFLWVLQLPATVQICGHSKLLLRVNVSINIVTCIIPLKGWRHVVGLWIGSKPAATLKWKSWRIWMDGWMDFFFFMMEPRVIVQTYNCQITVEKQRPWVQIIAINFEPFRVSHSLFFPSLTPLSFRKSILKYQIAENGCWALILVQYCSQWTLNMRKLKETAEAEK